MATKKITPPPAEAVSIASIGIRSKDNVDLLKVLFLRPLLAWLKSTVKSDQAKASLKKELLNLRDIIQDWYPSE